MSCQHCEQGLRMVAVIFFPVLYPKGAPRPETTPPEPIYVACSACAGTGVEGGPPWLKTWRARPE